MKIVQLVEQLTRLSNLSVEFAELAKKHNDPNYLKKALRYEARAAEIAQY